MTPDTNTPTPRQYFDEDGEPISLLKLIKAAPEWAENQIKHRDKLETELTAANQRAEKLQKQLDNFMASGIHTCHDQCKRPMCVLRREKEEALQIARELADVTYVKEYTLIPRFSKALQRLAKLEEGR
jgi:hypothetical protein